MFLKLALILPQRKTSLDGLYQRQADTNSRGRVIRIRLMILGLPSVNKLILRIKPQVYATSAQLEGMAIQERALLKI